MRNKYSRSKILSEVCSTDSGNFSGQSNKIFLIWMMKVKISLKILNFARKRDFQFVLYKSSAFENLCVCFKHLQLY